MRGGEAIIESLKNMGVKTIFGYPGGQTIPFYDMLYDADMDHILVRHEQAAAHAADGYARASGRVGVCLATSGPGATNLVTGIGTAYMDSSPIVAITGQVPTHLIGNDAFQEADIIGITMPITKHSYQPKDPDLIPSMIKSSFEIASRLINGIFPKRATILTSKLFILNFCYIIANFFYFFLFKSEGKIYLSVTLNH